MERILAFIFCIFFLAACNKNGSVQEPGIPAPTEPAESYLFKDIEYSIEEGDSEIVYVDSRPSFEYINKTSLTQRLPLNPVEGIKETSYFQSNDENAFALLNNNLVRVPIPVYISENNEISLGEKKWLYSDQQTEILTTLNLKDTISIDPSRKLILKMKLTSHEYSATYTATFVGQTSGNKVKIKGKWKGASPVKADVDSKFEKIADNFDQSER